MNHPTRGEWVEYIYEELEPPEQERLAGHLEACAECRRAVEDWQAVMGGLDAWELKEPARTVRVLPRLVRWAVAAAVLIAVGYGIGRLGGPDVAALRAELEPAIREAVLQEVEQRWQASLALSEARLRAEMDEKAVEAASAASSAAAGLITEYAQALDSVRRSDLLALARLTDQELRRTKWQMASALAYARPASGGPAGATSPDLEQEGGVQ